MKLKFEEAEFIISSGEYLMFNVVLTPVKQNQTEVKIFKDKKYLYRTTIYQSRINKTTAIDQLRLYIDKFGIKDV